VRAVANGELRYEHWQRLFQEVLLEHRPQELHSKIQTAEAAIYERLQAMAHDSSDQSERHAIADAVSTLRILQREKLSFPDGIDLEQMDAPPGGVEPEKRRGASRSVLVVDDNPAIRQAISQAFLADGFGVCTTADGGADAIDLVERLKPDVIILDLSMPRMNGLRTAPRLRKIAPDTPIILFTLYGHEPPIEQAAAIGVTLVLSKTESIFSVVSKARELVEDHGVPVRKTADS
jgi:CheY-like chemotaxis protein